METDRTLPNDSDAVHLSVIVPAYNSAGSVGRCLDAIVSQMQPDIEIVIVDDASTDNTTTVAAGYRVQLLTLATNGGAARARNRGVEIARGRILFFLDADVALEDGALARAYRALDSCDVDAVIGSYDDAPGDVGLVSQFKNLAHHYFHQHAEADVTTLFGACTVIGRDLFMAVGGFDERDRALEDVALGYRLTARGARIRLDPDLRVKHLKRWSLRRLVRTDITQRAIPWTALWLESGRLPKDLNFGVRQRLAAALAGAGGSLAIAALLSPIAILPLVGVIGAAAWANAGLYVLFFRRGGIRLMLAGFLLQQFYYVYSIVGLLLGLAMYGSPRLRPWMRRL